MTILAWFMVIGLPLIGLYAIFFFSFDWEWKTALRWWLGSIGITLGFFGFITAFTWALYVLVN